MPVKAVFLDLDDTLMDTSGILFEAAQKQAAQAMAKAGLPISWNDAFKRMNELREQFGPMEPIFERFVNEFNLSPNDKSRIAAAGMNAHFRSPLPKHLRLLPTVLKTLRALQKKGIKIIIVTRGIPERQRQKIQRLGLHKLVDDIEIQDQDSPTSKKEHFEAALQKFSLSPSECVSVGDRLHSEIRISNALGMYTVQMLHGRFAKLRPSKALEEPDFRIRSLHEILTAIRKIEFGKERNPRIVLIGGGTGLSNLLSGLKHYTPNLTAIVTVTDTGKSSGILRKEQKILPPGDIRNCLVALSDREELLRELLQYRFQNGSLGGHSFGNLLIAALTAITGSFEKAVQEAGRILAIQGKVLPVTLDNCHIGVQLQNGQKIVGEDQIISRFSVVHKRSPIQTAFLSPKSIKPNPEALREIRSADIIVLGPGSLYTSIIPNILVPGVSKAIQESLAKKVYVCNIMTQQGQTDHYSAPEHLVALSRFLGFVPQYIFVNTKKPSKPFLQAYEKEHAFLVDPVLTAFDRFSTQVIPGDFMQKNPAQKKGLNRREYLRHDPAKIANAILELVDR